MQYFNLIILATIFLSIFSLTSCNQTSDVDEFAEQKDERLNMEEITKLTRDNETTEQESDSAILDDLAFLNKFDKKYPQEVRLLNHPIIKNRLEKMLGGEYKFMKSIWEVETPIEINDGLFYAWGMQAHSGGDPGAVLMADLKKNIFYVGIRKDEKEQLYAEDGSKNMPQKLLDWADEF